MNSHLDTQTRLQRASGRASVLLPGLCIALAGLAAAALMVWMTVIAPQQREYRRNLAYAQGAALVAPLDRAIMRLQGEVQSIARSPALLAAAQGPERRLNGMPALEALVGARLLPAGQAINEDDGHLPLNAAVLDMIRRAQRGNEPALEAYGPRVYSVTPVRAADNAPVEAVLVMAFGVQRLTDNVTLETPQIGRISLIQQVFQDPAVQLLSLGSSATVALPLPTANPTWELHFQPGALYQDLPLVRFSLWSLLALGVALAAVIDGLWLTVRRARSR